MLLLESRSQRASTLSLIKSFIELSVSDIVSASKPVRTNLYDRLKPHKITSNKQPAAELSTARDNPRIAMGRIERPLPGGATNTIACPPSMRRPLYSSPLQTIFFFVKGGVLQALLNGGGEVNIIHREVKDQVGLVMDLMKGLTMRGVNLLEERADSCVSDHNLTLESDVNVRVNFWVFEKSPFDILLSQPFFKDHVQAILEDGGFLRMLIRDFDDPMKRVSLLLRTDPETVRNDIPLPISSSLLLADAFQSTCCSNNIEELNMLMAPSGLLSRKEA